MPQLTESAAEQLTPERATELVRILDLHATWDNHRNDRNKSAASHSDLHARQKAFDSFQAAWRAYATKYPDVQLPEPSHTMPDRLATWCRVLRVVFRLAAGGASSQVMAKVYRLADVIAARASEEPVVRLPSESLAEAAHGLGVVIAWCDKLTKSPAALSVLPEGRREEAA